MRKIALRGLIGRKGETALLWTVVTLAFLFLALPTTLITSLQATDAAQRRATYGNWQVMAQNLTAAQAEELAGCAGTAVSLPMLPVSGADYFQGDNNYFFAPYSPELVEMGQFQLREGHWPQAEDEIVLEYARMVSMGLEVGDTFAVQCMRELPMEAEHAQANEDAYSDARSALGEEAAARLRQPLIDFFLHGDWEVYGEEQGRTLQIEHGGITYRYDLAEAWRWSSWFSYDLASAFSSVICYYSWNEPYLGYLFAGEENPNGLEIPLLELTEEQFATVVDDFLYTTMPLALFEADTTRTTDLLGLDNMSVRVDFTDGMGAQDPMQLQMIYKYTVCGVIDTYTDRWDSGRGDLPSGFITGDSYQMFLDGQQLALEKYPFFEGSSFSYLLLLQDGEGSAGLWQRAVACRNRQLLEQDGFTVPQYQARGTDLVYNEYGRVVDYGEMHAQIIFPLFLADPDNPLAEEARSVTAWLAPSAIEEEGYCTDRLLEEADGEMFDWFYGGSVEDLRELEEDYFELRSQDGSSNSYSIGFRADLDGAAVLFDLDGERYSIPLEDFIAGNFTAAGLAPVPSCGEEIFWLDVPQNDFSTLRFNHLAYPSGAESGGSLLLLVMGILFVTTVCAVFQICFTQIRRRLRRVVLLKSLGAETGQVAGMMAWEFLYFWLTAAPVGTALGLLGAFLAAQGLSASQGRTVLLTVDPQVLLLAVGAGTAALALGMAVPALLAVGVPLTGRTVRKKPLPPPKRETRQDFFHVTVRGLAAKKGRTAGTFALCALMMSIAVLCLFLGFRMLGEYRETVVRDGKPDYLLRAPYAMNLPQREEYLAELAELGVCGQTSTYFTGSGIQLERAAWEESPLLTVAAGDTEAETAGSYPVNLWAISSGDSLFSRLQAAATVGELDPAAFDSGDQVLLLIPLYRDTGKVNEELLETTEGWARLAASGIETSYYAEYNGVYSRDPAIQVGDPLPLYVEGWSVQNEQYVMVPRSASPTVGAIVYYFPGTAVWPLGVGEGWQVVASPKVLSSVLESACRRRSEEEIRAIYLQQNAFEMLANSFGTTDFYIDCAPDVSLETADTSLLIFARNHYMELEVYHESSDKMLRDGVNNVLLVCLLGLTALLLSLIIFYNTIASDIEQERGRIGILQSLGVSNARLVRRQLVLGLIAAAIALAVGNGLLWSCVAIYAGSTGAVLNNLLWGYPAVWHGALCLAVAALIAALFTVPMLRLRHYLPVENIRTKK